MASLGLGEENLLSVSDSGKRCEFCLSNQAVVGSGKEWKSKLHPTLPPHIKEGTAKFTCSYRKVPEGKKKDFQEAMSLNIFKDNLVAGK